MTYSLFSWFHLLIYRYKASSESVADDMTPYQILKIQAHHQNQIYKLK